MAFFFFFNILLLFSGVWTLLPVQGASLSLWALHSVSSVPWFPLMDILIPKTVGKEEFKSEKLIWEKRW